MLKYLLLAVAVLAVVDIVAATGWLLRFRPAFQLIYHAVWWILVYLGIVHPL